MGYSAGRQRIYVRDLEARDLAVPQMGPDLARAWRALFAVRIGRARVAHGQELECRSWPRHRLRVSCGALPASRFVGSRCCLAQR